MDNALQWVPMLCKIEKERLRNFPSEKLFFSCFGMDRDQNEIKILLYILEKVNHKIEYAIQSILV